MRASCKLAAKIFGVFFLWACSTTTIDEYASPGEKKRQQLLERYRAEVEIGRNMAGRLLQYYGTSGDEDLIYYVNQVGNYVASFSPDQNRRYMFGILDSDIVNAYACPGGYILITLGTLKMIQNEAELAMILGHEIAHIAKGHMFNTLQSMSAKEREKAAQKTEKLDKNDHVIALRKRPSTNQKKSKSVKFSNV